MPIPEACHRGRAAAAQILEQQNHLMFPVGGPSLAAAVGRLLVAGNALGPLCPGCARIAPQVENAGAQKLRDELQFVGGQALDETAGLGSMGTIGTRNQGGYQSTSHGRSPVGEESYQK
jgi:hypothetical protein